MKRTIAIVGGTGAEGTGLAWRWAQAGEHVLIGSRDPHKAAQRASEILQRVPHAQVEGLGNAEAVARAQVVVLTVPFAAHAATLKQLRPFFLPGTILIDTTVPLESSVGGRATRVLGLWAGSAAQQAAHLVPAHVRVVAAFHTVSAERLQSDDQVETDVVVCGDDPEARQTVIELAEKIPGIRAFDAGRLEAARSLEHLTALLMRLNLRYGAHGAGIRFTGLSTAPR